MCDIDCHIKTLAFSSMTFQTANRASRTAVLCGWLLGERSPGGEGRLGAEPGVDEADSAAEQSQPRRGLSRDHSLPVPSAAAAGMRDCASVRSCRCWGVLLKCLEYIFGIDW